MLAVKMCCACVFSLTHAHCAFEHCACASFVVGYASVLCIRIAHAFCVFNVHRIQFSNVNCITQISLCCCFPEFNEYMYLFLLTSEIRFGFIILGAGLYDRVVKGSSSETGSPVRIPRLIALDKLY